MNKVLLGVTSAVVMLCASASFADDRDFKLINATGYPIKFLGVNAPGDEVWNENELSGILDDGSNIKVKFSGSDKGCKWNIKVTWSDDNSSSYFRGLNLCKIETVTLKYDRKTDTASYIAD